MMASLLVATAFPSSTVYYEAPTPPTIEELIVEKSTEYGVSASLMRSIITCESSGNPNAIGDNGQSFGLVQIHSPSWPDITKEQATNPEFAIDFLAKKLSEGDGNLWSCYKIVTRR